MSISMHNEKLPPRQLQTRINPNYVPLSRLSMDLKVMPRSHKCYVWQCYVYVSLRVV